MKKIFNTLSIVACILGSSLNAQTNKSVSGSTSNDVQISPSDSKSKFVSNQDYLSPSSLKDYKNFYGDSLKGFDEAAVKSDLVSRFYYGQEFIAVMNFRKREFIDAKYKIGAYAAKAKQPVQPAQPKTNSKPIGGNPNTINLAPCVNEDFELTLPGNYNNVASPVTGWTVQSTSSLGNQLACGTPTNAAWITGSPEFSIVATPVLGHPYIGNIPNSPLGGNNVAVLNNTVPGFTVTRISTTFPVTNANVLFQFAYAGSWDGSGHACCDQPFFTINMFDCTGAPLGCSSISLTPPGISCQNGAQGYSITPAGISWCNWQIKYIDLTPYIGQCVTMRITNGDCNGGAHHGSLYFDAKCGGNLLCNTCGPPSGSITTIPGPVSFCAGSGQAQITAPTGYATYSWVAPPGAPAISAAQATLQNLTINNPIPGTVYTVNLVSQSGCLFVSTNTINFTSVNIAGIASAASCAGGASGTATVIGNGSGTGYNYSWYNSTNSVVSTASVATGLAAGIYSIVISGLGAAGCGSAIATITVATAPPGVINMFKPFCGNVAYLSTAGGTNFQWYNNGAAVTPSLGGTLPTYTINSPTTGQIITLTYHSNLGCQDSVRFTLAATNPGFISATSITSVCPGASNGSALVTLITAQGAPPGLNNISVTSTGSTPAFNATTPSPNVNSISLTGLSGGTYAITATDGSCFYSSNFSVNTFVYTYNVSPNIATLCNGSSIASAVTFANPLMATQFTYAWSPTTNLFGANAQNIIVSPTTAIGTQNMYVYTVTVTPKAINCPIAKSLSITVVNPVIPSFTLIPNLCDISAPYQIQASPVGGIFSTTVTGANNPLTPGGLISPSLALNSTTNFTYVISVLNCTAKTTGNFSVSKYISSALSSTAPPMCITNAPFNLMNIVQTTGGTWSGPGVTPGNSQFSPSNFANQAAVTTSYGVTYSIPSTPIGSVCPSNTLLPIFVTKTITPTIPQLAEFCTSFPQLTLTASPPGGGWLPAMGVNNAGIVTPGNITLNNVIATYTVNVGPCLNVNTTTLHISKFVPATITGTVNNLCYNSSNFNLSSIVANTSGTWTSNNGQGVLTNSFFPAGLPTGIYPLTYSIFSSPNPTLCPDQQTLAVSVLNPPMPTITQIGPYCNNGSSVQLTVSPSSGHWVSSAYLNSTGVFNPALSSVGNNAVQYIIGTNSCNRSDSKFISIEAFVPATIISTIPDLCNNNPVMNLSPFTLNNQGTWTGAGITGTSFNPAATGSGNFNLTYHTSSSPSGLCPDVASISVNVFSLAVPALSQIGPFCTTSLPVQLQVSPIGGLFGGAIPGLVSVGGAFNPSRGLIGNNIVNYSITSGPCVAYAQTSIKVEKFISANFVKPVGPFCQTNEAVNLNGFVQNPGGQWSQESTGTGLAGNMFNPSLAAPGSKNEITYITNSTTKDLCPDKKTIIIEVKKSPVSHVVTSYDGSCAPLEVVFNAQDFNYNGGSWSFSDGSEPLNELSGTHVFTIPGSYNIQFNYTDETGCKAVPVKTDDIVVHSLPKADFSTPQEIYISEPQVLFTNQSTVLGENGYKWKIGNFEPRFDLSPLVTFTAIGKYQVTLTATSVFGCKNEITKTVEVKNNFNLFMPNTFSPNFDGLNDYFVPVYTKEGLDVKYFEMEIFDRWGHSLFRTKDISKGWDGLGKGEPLKEDLYIYKVKYKDAEGVLYEKMGNVSIVR